MTRMQDIPSSVVHRAWGELDDLPPKPAKPPKPPKQEKPKRESAVRRVPGHRIGLDKGGPRATTKSGHRWGERVVLVKDVLDLKLGQTAYQIATVTGMEHKDAWRALENLRRVGEAKNGAKVFSEHAGRKVMTWLATRRTRELSGMRGVVRVKLWAKP